MSSESEVENELARLRAKANPQAIEAADEEQRHPPGRVRRRRPTATHDRAHPRRGQYDVSDEALPRLNELDATVEQSVETGDVDAFTSALTALLEGVRTVGAAPGRLARRVRPDPAAVRRHDRRGP